MGKKDRSKSNRPKRPSRRKRPAPARATTGSRAKRRLALRSPEAWPGELPADVAVFDEAARQQLPPEQAEQAGAVAEALRLISEGRGEEADPCVSGIPRRSPLSQWRLLIRGLVDWEAGERQAAASAWSRLDPRRRPGRIARALQLSERSDLEAIEPAEPKTAAPAAEDASASSAPDGDQPPIDRALWSSAKLVRQLRVERSALAEARRETARREPDKDILLGPEKLRWLKDFSTEYRQVEPELVDALQRETLHRAYSQPYVDAFEEATAAFPGPPHDPKNTLLESSYHERFRGGEARSERALLRYLRTDLPANRQLSPSVRDALVSQISLEEARAEMAPPGGSGLMARLAFGREDEEQVERWFGAAIGAYPANRDAHREYVEWIRSRTENERLTKAEREPFEQRLPAAMQAWSDGLPEDEEPRLWLVDHYLEQEQMDAAKPHVEWLERSRQNDPRVRAMPWKWQLLEAMRLCRRKAWLDAVPEKLDAAEALWPAWLPRDWLPYLRAALALRRGDQPEYQRRREAIRQEKLSATDGSFSELADAVMTLGAAQRMRVPSADLKPLRAPVDQAAKALAQPTTSSPPAASFGTCTAPRCSIPLTGCTAASSPANCSTAWRSRAVCWARRINSLDRPPSGSPSRAFLSRCCGCPSTGLATTKICGCPRCSGR